VHAAEGPQRVDRAVSSPRAKAAPAAKVRAVAVPPLADGLLLQPRRGPDRDRGAASRPSRVRVSYLQRRFAGHARAAPHRRLASRRRAFSAARSPSHTDARCACRLSRRPRPHPAVLALPRALHASPRTAALALPSRHCPAPLAATPPRLSRPLPRRRRRALTPQPPPPPPPPTHTHNGELAAAAAYGNLSARRRRRRGAQAHSQSSRRGRWTRCAVPPHARFDAAPTHPPTHTHAH